MMKHATTRCPQCPETFTASAQDDQHAANMAADAALVLHLEAAHPIGAPPG